MRQIHVKSLRLCIGINMKSQIQIKGTTFFFTIHNKVKKLGERFVEVIKTHQKQLEPHIRELNLPKQIELIIGVESCYDSIAHKFENAIFVSGEEFYELERKMPNENFNNVFELEALFVFLHECAHFKTSDETKADRIAHKILRKLGFTIKKLSVRNVEKS